MPKSKRDKIVHLTKVKKKGKDHKEDLIKTLEEYLNNYSKIYLFDFEQTKSDTIMGLRIKLKSEGRIFSGKNSLVTLTLKKIAAKRNQDYDKLIKQVFGHVGLFFTNMDCDKLMGFLEKEKPEFTKRLVSCTETKPKLKVNILQKRQRPKGDEKDE